MKKSKSLISLAMLLLFSVTTISCGSAAKQDQGNANNEYKYGKIRIQALSGSVCGAPAYIAYEKGFFKEEGLEAELVSGTLDDNKTGLVTGANIVTNGDFQWFPSIQQGMDLKVIGGLHKGCIKIIIPKDSPIKTAADLKGKNIGVDQIGGTPMSVATMVLGNEGIDPKIGVTWKPYPLDQLNEAFKKGEVDAFAAWDPFGSLAVENGEYKALTDIGTDPLFKGKSCCFLYASNKQIKENPEKVKAVANAYKKATEWIKAHPQETAQIEIDKKYISSGDVDFVTKLIKSYDFEYTTDNAKDDINYFVKKLDNTGFLKEDTDPEKFTNDTYYDIFNK